MLKVIQLLEKTSEFGVKYYQELDKAGFGGMQPYLVQFINTHVDKISDNMKIKKLVNTDVNLNSAFVIWSYISDSRDILHQLLEIFHDNPITAESSRKMSFGYLENIESSLQDFETALQECNKVLIQENIPEMLANELLQKVKHEVPELMKFIDNAKQHKNVELIKVIFKKVYEAGFQKPNSKELTLHLQNSIRDIQNTLFNVNNTRKKQPNALQELVQQFDLVPIRNLDLPGSDNNKKLTAYARVQERYIMAIYKTFPHSKEHSILPIIDNNLAMKMGLFQSAYTGVNPKYIARSKTIKAHEKTREKSRIEYYGNPKHAIMILETLNGYDWRELKSSKVFQIESYQPSDLVEKYNSTLQDQILSKLRTPYLDMLSWSELKLQESRWIGIRARIKTEIMQELQKGKKDLKTYLKSSVPVRVIMQIASSEFWENKKITDSSKLQRINKELSLIFLSESAFLEEKFTEKIRSNLTGGIENYESALEETLKYFINSKSGLLVAMKNKVEQLEKAM